MRAIVVTEFGGPEVLELQDVPPPEGELLVDVTVAGVNFRDIYERTGRYGGTPPLVAGAEGAGRVAATGERVVWAHAQGSYAEQIVVPPDRAVPIPDGVSDELAAASILQGMTAHYLTHSTYPVQPGDEVLVHAGRGRRRAARSSRWRSCAARGSPPRPRPRRKPSSRRPPAPTR